MKKQGMTAIAFALLLSAAATARTLPETFSPGETLPEAQRTSVAVQPESAAAFKAPTAPAASSVSAVQSVLNGKAQLPQPILQVPVTNQPRQRYSLPTPKAASTADLAGQYVQTYKSLVSTLGDGGVSCYITALGTDSITIHNFWATKINVKAHFDAATGAITIPAQFLYNHATYGAMWLAMCGSDGKPNYSTNLTGTLKSDGSLAIDTWWGIFVKEGASANQFMMVAYNTLMQKANATMTCGVYGSKNPEVFNVIVNQNFDNQVTVLNFGNYGMEVVIDLNRHYSGVIHSQCVRQYPANADFLSCSVGGFQTTESGGTSLLAPMANDIMLDTLTNQKQTNSLSWKFWTAISSGSNGNYFLAAWTSGKIETQTPITFPVLNQTDFTGSGTQADPYQIKTREDLILMSQKAEDSEEWNTNKPLNDNPAYREVQAFRGKYFKVMNDIDMSGTNFTPIGMSYYKRFAGNFDGGNYTIKNLTVDIQLPYAGLFGEIDTIGSIKNVRLLNPDIATTSNYAGALVAWSYAKVENCHVSGGTVIGEGQVVGGLIGSASVGLDNCSANNMSVAGAGGWTGGLAGQIVGPATNSSATEMMVLAYPGSGVAAGGFAGLISAGKGENIYFSGTMDAYRMGAPSSSGVVTGSVVGILSLSTLNNAFGVGTVLGRNSYCEVGGLVGRVQASTVNNCYFRGRVGSYYSRNTGGLVGRVISATNNGTPAPSTLTNLYVGATEELEDYQYNRVTGWAETLGTVDEGAIATAQNIYYDEQLFSRKSQNGTAMTTAQFTSGTLPAGFSSSIWSATAGQYPTLKNINTNNAANWGASAILFNNGASVNKVNQNVKLSAVGNTEYLFYVQGKGVKDGHAAQIVGDSLKVKDFGVDTLLCINNNANYYIILKCAPVPYAGSGTEDDPYQIKTKADLISLAKFANESQQYFPGSYFLQMNDIDMELDQDFAGIATVASDAHCKFAGIYDGGGHTLHRLYLGGLNPVDPTVRPSGTGYVGFIGRLNEDGILRNLNFAADCDFTHMWASCGPAVGVNTGLVENIRNYADVQAMSCWVGGIVGMNDKPGYIRNCYNAGNVISGYNSAGGISGRNNGGIENCANAGDVRIITLHPLWTNNRNVAGGITTNMSDGYIKNVLNVGLVEAEGPNVGGIIGSYQAKSVSATGVGNNDILYAVSYAAVRTPQMATGGAIAGYVSTNKKPSSPTRVIAYYDEQISLFGAYGNETFEGMYGLTTAKMTSGQPLDSLSTDYWQFDAGQYPTLKLFANEPKLQNARKVIMTMPTDVSVRDLTQNATLSSGATWSVAPATYFSISGSLLRTGTVPSALQQATVTATLGNYTKQIDIQRIPPVPLTGQGTQASPYLITSATDWNNLASYINAVHDNFAGKYLKITQDIDFSSTTFSELFLDAADMLAGTLDGDGHTVNLGTNKFVPVNTYEGPIRCIAETGVLQNITFKGDISTNKTGTAAVVGNVNGTMRNVISEVNLTSSVNYASAFGRATTGTAVLEKVVNKGTITGNSTQIAGIFSDATNPKMTDCGNEGVIKTLFNGTAPSSGQGIGGLIGNSTAAKMTRCYNTGRFEFTKPEVMYGIGGLIGWAKSTSANTDSTVLVGCYNTATIEAGFMIGGILANMDGSATIPNVIHMRDCYNTGNITSRGTVSKTAGGIAGLMAMYHLDTELLGCYNTGTINNTNAKQAYAAGLIAYYKTAPTVAAPALIANCYNAGDIYNAYNYSGGIIAYCSNYTTIDGCYNTGDLEALIGSGGIAANLGSVSAKAINCWNSGNLTVSDSRAGGIAGQATVATTISDCFNVGNITNSAETVTANATTHQATKGYGAGGIAGEGGGNMTRCYNLGSIKGIANVGGLVGRPSKNSTILTDCYNAGEIQAPADTCGSLIGIDFATAGRLWDATKNGVNNCYYLKVDSLVNNTVGMAKTRGEIIELNLGSNWTSAIPYTYPMLKSNLNDMARLWAAQIIFKDNNTMMNVTQDFFVGVPEGVTWTPSIGNLSLQGNLFHWSPEEFRQAFTLTAACGPYKRVFNLKADKNSGVDDLGDQAEIASEIWYTIGGIQVNKPAVSDGQIYIVVRTYTDGTRRTLRIRN